MALITTVAGAYTGYYSTHYGHGPYYLGVMADRGYELSWSMHAHVINDTTAWGKTLIDGVHLGADWRIRFVGKEWSRTGLRTAAWPWGSEGDGYTVDDDFDVIMGQIGDRFSTRAGSMSLSAASLTPAVDYIATMNIPRVIPTPGSGISFMMTSKERFMAVDLTILPYQDRGDDPGILTTITASASATSTSSPKWFYTV